MTPFSRHDRAEIDRILRDPGDKVIATLAEMRDYARHRAAEARLKEREGRRQAAKVAAAGRRFLDALALIDPAAGAVPFDTGGTECRASPDVPNVLTPKADDQAAREPKPGRRPQRPQRPPAGEPTGAMLLVWNRGGDHQDVLAAGKAVRRVLELLRPTAPRAGRTPKTTVYAHVIRDLATIYRRRTRRRPTSSPAGDFAALVRIVLHIDNPKDEIAAALSRKLRRTT